MFALVTELAYVLVEDQPDFVGSTPTEGTNGM